MAGIFGVLSNRQSAKLFYSTLFSYEQQGSKNTGQKNACYGEDDRSGSNVAAYSSNNERSIEAEKEKSERSRRIHELIRELNQTTDKNENSYSNPLGLSDSGLLETSRTSDKDDKTNLEKPVNYNYKEIASLIIRAKSSLSAGKALLSAKRKVLQIKRKITNGDGDPEELRMALTHAKRMEMAARKKKNHLELEELVNVTMKRDENIEKRENSNSELRSSIVYHEEEKLSVEADEIFEKREEMTGDLKKMMKEEGRNISKENIKEINEMISEFGEEELKELEEAMEVLENMEIINPHMSKEDLEDLKRKHRDAENKAIIKANMDYLKDMIKYQMDKGAVVSGMNSDISSLSSALSSAGISTADVCSVSAHTLSAISVDVQI
ncbi:MAG: hypothetical protein K6B28_05265 [Lachnospiraceae bacterium]|nr:hypothetical protein [Lachnospiraceae bacterium]